MKLAIIGAGITGLATALALYRKGVEAHVYERAAAFTEIGLGFIVLPNGVTALREMNALPTVPEEAISLNRAQLQTPAGDVFKSEPLTDCLGVKRSRIIESLVREIPPHLVHMGYHLSHYDQDAQGHFTVAHFDNGVAVEADYFIAADGANSPSRTTLFPGAQLRQTPIQELVGMADAPALAKRLRCDLVKTQDWDAHLSFGILPCNETQVIWYMQYHSKINPLPTLEPWVKRSFTKDLMNGWPAVVQEVIEATDFENVFCWQTRDMDLLPAFHRKNLVLVGDAAHVALPFTSQGTSSGLSDALMLADLFASGAVERDADTAFGEYYEARHWDVVKYLEFGRHLEQRFLTPQDFAGQEMPLPLAK